MMKNLMPCLLAVLLSSAVQALDIVRDGKAEAVIVKPDRKSFPADEAALWLKNYIEKATGAKLEIFTEGKAPKDKNIISVGNTEMAKQAGIDTGGLKWDSSLLKVKGNTLFIAGRDNEVIQGPLKGAGPQGTCKAATEFLERYLGIRWFLPVPDGEHIPQNKNLSVPSDLNISFTPVFAYAYGGGKLPPPMAAALNIRNSMKVRHYGGHSWRMISAEKYFKDHPEYYALVAGKRVADPDNPMLCVTNPEVRKIMVDEMRKIFDEGYEAIELGQSDGWKSCQCEECMKSDKNVNTNTVSREHPCEKILEMHKWICDRLYESHPDKKVLLIIYGPTAWPSKKIDKWPPNVIAEFAPPDRERMDAWKGKINEKVTYTYWWCGSTAPIPLFPQHFPEWFRQTLQDFRKENVIGIYGGGALPSQENWGLFGPAYYSFGKLLDNPERDTEKLLNEYCTCVYGEEAGAVMKRFFEKLYKRSEFCEDMFAMKIDSTQSKTERIVSSLFPPSFISELELLLAKAEKKTKTEKEKKFMRLTRDDFDYLKIISNMFLAKHLYEAEATEENLLRLKDWVGKFEAWRQKILSYPPEYTEKWFPGHHQACTILMSGGDNNEYNAYWYNWKRVEGELAELRAGKRSFKGHGVGSDLGGRGFKAPLTWDFDKLLANVGKTETEKSITADYVSGKPVIDGNLNDKIWQNAQKENMELFQNPGSRIPDDAVTQLALAYDDENLYVAFWCREPETGKMKLKEVGRDGYVYGLEEVEALFDPENSYKKFMHFMAAPFQNAFYDERCGYKANELDPENRDVEWNPEWKYGFSIDKEKGMWYMEMSIPFKSIGMKTPVSGTVLRANFARVRRVNSALELSCWAPGSFCDAGKFGEIEFRKDGEKKKLLIRNGSFEEINEKGYPDDWNIGFVPEKLKACFSVTDEKAHTGKKALKIDFSSFPVKLLEEKERGSISWTQAVSKDILENLKGKKIRFSAWLYYENISSIRNSGPSFVVRSWKGKDLISKDPSVQLSLQGLTEQGYASIEGFRDKWIKVEAEGIIPPETERMDFHCSISKKNYQGESNDSSVYVDDINASLVP